MKSASFSLARSLFATAQLTTALAACSSSTGSSSTTGGGGGYGGATGGTGGMCHGDATTWAMLTAGPIACTKSSDCCVVVNGCLSQSQIVAATNMAQAAAAWPYCDGMCNKCIPPAIEVGCDNGLCAGKVVDLADASADLWKDHCGVDPLVGLDATTLHFGCEGS